MKVQLFVLVITFLVVGAFFLESDAATAEVIAQHELNQVFGGTPACCSGASTPNCPRTFPFCNINYNKCDEDPPDPSFCTNPVDGEGNKIKQCTSFGCTAWRYKEDCD